MTSEEIMQELLGELDMAGMDTYLEQSGVKITFAELVHKIVGQGWGVESIGDIAEWMYQLLFQEIQTNKEIFLEVILITFCFTLLKNIIGNFGSSYISEVCFWLVYSVLALLLLKSIYLIQGMVADTINRCTSYMQIFVPCFCTGLFFSANAYTANGFYQMAFLLIYFVDWAFQKILLPCVDVYILLQLFNHFFEEEQFVNLAELLKSFVLWGLKISTTVVFGMGVVQNLLNPVKDRMAQGVTGKVTAIIPGVGRVAEGVGELVLGSGMVIKNGLGIAGMIAILCIGLVPLMKTLCVSFFYKIMAAMTEPLADRRISGCIQKLSYGATLYLKLQSYCVLIFIITIALTVSATSFIY